MSKVWLAPLISLLIIGGIVLHAHAEANKQYIQSGKITWADKNINNFVIKLDNGFLINGTSKDTDGMLFGEGQRMWVEYDKYGNTKQFDTYNPVHIKVKFWVTKITDVEFEAKPLIPNKDKPALYFVEANIKGNKHIKVGDTVTAYYTPAQGEDIFRYVVKN